MAAPTDPPLAASRTVVLLAGPSGSGKSRVTRRAGMPSVNLDDFYRDADAPGLPRIRGLVDWDALPSWDVEAALAVLIALCRTGSAEIPVYDIPANRRVGSRRLKLGSAPALLAEGLFAADLVPSCQALGLRVQALYLDPPRGRTLVLRLLRDLREHRKPLAVLVRRGLSLWRSEPALRRHAMDRGCRPVTQRQAMALVRSLSDLTEASSEPDGDPARR